MEKLTDFLKYIKIVPLLETYSDINPKAGIRHQIAGIGTNKTDKKTTLTPKNEEGLRSALKQFCTDGIEFLDKSE